MIEVVIHNAERVYGDANPTFAYTASGLTGDSWEDVLVEGRLVTPAGILSPVGTYVITEDPQGRFEVLLGYEVRVIDGTLTVKPRPITVAADPKEKLQHEPDPELTYRIVEGNLVGTDRLAGRLSREKGEALGQYAILQGTLSNPNYEITFVPALLTIYPRPEALGVIPVPGAGRGPMETTVVACMVVRSGPAGTDTGSEAAGVVSILECPEGHPATGTVTDDGSPTGGGASGARRTGETGGVSGQLVLEASGDGRNDEPAEVAGGDGNKAASDA